jgi:hypothetical protein
MKKLALFLCLAGLVTAPVWGQDVDKPKLGHAYVFVAPGAATTFACRSCTAGTIHFGGGAEIGDLGFMEGLDNGVQWVSVLSAPRG